MFYDTHQACSSLLWRYSLSSFWKKIQESWDIVDIMYNNSVEIFESKKKPIAEGDEAGPNQTGAGKGILSIQSQTLIEPFDHNSLPSHQ